MLERNNFYGNGYPCAGDGMYNINYYKDINNRIDRIERQIRRLEQRLVRVEVPYSNNINNYNNEPDDNMYMM